MSVFDFIEGIFGEYMIFLRDVLSEDEVFGLFVGDIIIEKLSIMEKVTVSVLSLNEDDGIDFGSAFYLLEGHFEEPFGVNVCIECWLDKAMST